MSFGSKLPTNWPFLLWFHFNLMSWIEIEILQNMLGIKKHIKHYNFLFRAHYAAYARLFVLITSLNSSNSLMKLVLLLLTNLPKKKLKVKIAIKFRTRICLLWSDSIAHAPLNHYYIFVAEIFIEIIVDWHAVLRNYLPTLTYTHLCVFVCVCVKFNFISWVGLVKVLNKSNTTSVFASLGCYNKNTLDGMA